jgi:exodeoxyribonuclease V beta subunit
LHAIFEYWDFKDHTQLLEICEKQLTLYGLAEHSTEGVAQWMTGVVQQIIPGVKSDLPFSLSQLEKHNRLDEMEFYLPVGLLEASTIDALLGGDNRFQFQPLTGYLKGFIDLIFEWQGRYYVADYKSNYLGLTANDYLPESLIESMRDHKYDLQSWIYTVALDQMLSQRLADYSPEKHLGGSLYLYLRGMGDHFSDATPDSGICYTPVDIEQLEKWRSVLLRSRDVEASV